MAVSITTDLVTLYTANTAFGGGTVYTGFQRFGTGCNGFQANTANTNFHRYGTVTSFNLVGKSIYSWMIGPASIDTYANGGYRIVIGDGTNIRAYFVGGRDLKSFSSQGWYCFILNGDNLPTNFTQIAGASQPNLSNLTQVGVGFRATTKATGNSPNCFYDVARYGTGLVIGGGTSADPGKFSEILSQDDSINNAWGIIESLGTGIYGVQGRLTFGSTTSSSYFEDINSTIVYENRLVSTSFYQFNVQGSSANTNVFQLGTKLGTGDNASGLNGCTIQSSDPVLKINFTGTNVNNLNIYGSTFYNCKDTIDLSTNNNHEFIGNTIIKSGQVNANQMYIRNCFFNNTYSTDSSLLWNNTIDIRNSSFIGNSDITNNPAAIEHDSTGTYNYYDLLFLNNDYDVLNTSNGQVTINSINTSNPSTFLNQGTSTTTINNVRTFKLTGLKENTEIRLIRKTDRFEIDGIENSGTEYEYQYNYTGDIEIYVHIHNLQYEFIRLESILTSTNTTIPIQQNFDRNYKNPV